MRFQNRRRSLLATAVVVSLVVPGALVYQSAANAAVEGQLSPDGCADLTLPEENHASIRLQTDQPASEAEVSVDERGEVTVGGILHKHATIVEVSDGQATSSEFTLGPPPGGVPAWAASWTTSMRPTHLGSNQVCAYAERDPKRSARIMRSFTVVDLIPPSAVPDLAVSDITATTATVTWGAATDNYGLAGYEVTVDGGTAHRTTVGTRSYTATGLAPSTSHTVSVVAIDLAGNTSTTPATVSFTTAAPPPPPDGNLTLEPEQGGATATWEPDLPTEVTYRTFLNDQLFEEFPPNRYCQDADGNPASPCTSEDVISYPIEPLEEGTPYTFRVDALAADDTVARSFSGSFTTTVGRDLVLPETTQLLASESSRCAGMGGDLYVAPDARASVPVPAGSTQLFAGCYTTADSSCIDSFLPPSGEALIECADDITELLFGVAPPGRGPVISSIDDIAAGGPAPAQVRVEPVTWCAQGACTLLLAPPAQAVRIVAVAPAAAASSSFIIVAAAGIGIGLALGVLLAILFPTELGIGGLLEYPIDFETDFDTFDNWGLNEGDWYNSLKMYAEVIRTTNLLTGRHDIPFAWNSAEDGRLKRTIDRACSAQQGGQSLVGACDEGFAVYVPGGVNYRLRPMDQTATHIVTAMDDGDFPPPERVSWFYPGYSRNGQAARNAGFDRRWYYTAPFMPNACTPPVAGQTCDEFPFWSTDQAVNLSGVLADVAPVPTTESLPQANDLRQFYRQCDVADTDRFIVLPVKSWVEANGPSFGFRVSPGGASLCLAPEPPGGP